VVEDVVVKKSSRSLSPLLMSFLYKLGVTHTVAAPRGWLGFNEPPCDYQYCRFHNELPIFVLLSFRQHHCRISPASWESLSSRPNNSALPVVPTGDYHPPDLLTNPLPKTWIPLLQVRKHSGYVCHLIEKLCNTCPYS